ncbi:hypothetical protein [Taibaiella koreensis]|uniref:hypothetical protein n=1 Tax=Taibaiella koreensis TaxID=1268548 RepID=UPI000E59ED06|nr:hypothetical protein [Taibaiella koreensis]
MDEMIVFSTYPTLEAAEQAAMLLRNNGITAEAKHEMRSLDSNYLGQQFGDPYLLYLPGKDFDRARTILEDHTVVDPGEVDPGYQLLTFSDDELIDVMMNKEEWGIYNYKLAAALLKRRNVPIPEAQIGIAEAEQLREKEKAVSSGLSLLLLGYSSLLSGAALALVRHPAFTLLPGGLALFVGWILSYTKRTLSNGVQVHYYKPAARLHGLILFWGALGFAVIRYLILWIQYSGT